MMIFAPDIFLDALLLLIGDNSDRSRSLVEELVECEERTSRQTDLIVDDSDLVGVYKRLIRSVIDGNVTQDEPASMKVILLKVKTDPGMVQHPEIADILSDVLSSETKITAQQIDTYLTRIRNSLIIADLDAQTRQLFSAVRKAGDLKNVENQTIQIEQTKKMFESALKKLDQRQNVSESKASETYVSLSDPDSIVRALKTFMERSVNGIVRSGLQGLNRATGKRGGMGLGEAWVFAANSHNYKTGMLVSIMLWTIIYNRIEVPEGMRGLVYFISLENEVNQNLMDVFKMLYCRIEKKHPDVSEMGAEVIKNWLCEYFSKFSVDLIIDRYTPHEFTFGKFVGRFNSFVEMGYFVILFDLDYMSEARGIDPGDTMSTQGQIQLIKENYLKFANHAKQNGYLLTTGHQLTKRAAEIASNYRLAVKKFNESMMADSSDVYRIIDGLIYLHLEDNVNGVKFLTAQLRKNRYGKDTRESDKFFAYPFTEFGIVDDFEGLPAYVTDIDAWGIEGASDDQIQEAAMF